MNDQAINWEHVAKADMHPLRLALLRLFAGNPEERYSPKTIVETLPADMPGNMLGNVSYHVRQLHGLGLIRKAGTAPRRGAVQHYYRATGTLIVRPSKAESKANGRGAAKATRKRTAAAR